MFELCQVLPQVPNPIGTRILFLLCSWLKRGSAIHQTRPQKWGALLKSLIFVIKDPFLSPDLSRTRMTMSSCVSETWVTSAQGRLIGSASRARIIGTLIKTSGNIFTIRFVTQWLLLNILLNFLCSAQQYTSSSLLWIDYCRINVDERVVICLKAYSSFTKVSLLFVLMYVITFIMNFRFV